MSAVHQEGKLQFTFDDGWVIQKWDDHAAYRKGVGCVRHSCAVDFCGLRGGSVFFIEVKDFRGHRIENKGRLREDSPDFLADEVARKVRDTVAGIIGARRSRLTEEPTWGPLTVALGDPSVDVRVVLWLEEDVPRNSPASSTLQEHLKKKLSWLTTKVVVESRKQPQVYPPGLSAQNLAGAGMSSAHKPKQPPTCSYCGALL